MLKKLLDVADCVCKLSDLCWAHSKPGLGSHSDIGAVCHCWDHSRPMHPSELDLGPAHGLCLRSAEHLAVFA